MLDGDRPIPIAGSKRRAVLALLLLHANEVVRTERLIDELWSEQQPRNASGALHNHVSRLRKALGPEVLARRDQVVVDFDNFMVTAANPICPPGAQGSG